MKKAVSEMNILNLIKIIWIDSLWITLWISIWVDLAIKVKKFAFHNPKNEPYAPHYWTKIQSREPNRSHWQCSTHNHTTTLYQVILT